MGLVVSSKKSALSYFSGKTPDLRALGWHGSWGPLAALTAAPQSRRACPPVLRAPSSSFVHLGPARCLQALGRELSFAEQNGFFLSPSLVRTRSCLGQAGGGDFGAGCLGGRAWAVWGCQGGPEEPWRGKESSSGRLFAGGLGRKRAGSPSAETTECHGFRRVPSIMY